ncbi:MAG: hypothetical protein COZ47_00175 [Lysobacterales bacterium CG_4_10_14_3_um_filter_64_11]|nr:MAG: hypothetical protein COZ47_00175 [Xanthomonadales bacterium CG_4_10_14_3_um_filter_64_11]
MHTSPPTFTAAQAAQKMPIIAPAPTTAFTAAQAAQKSVRPWPARVRAFTAAQAAQNTDAAVARVSLFTTAQASRKVREITRITALCGGAQCHCWRGGDGWARLHHPGLRPVGPSTRATPRCSHPGCSPGYSRAAAKPGARLRGVSAFSGYTGR